MINTFDILETIKMIQDECLDIRTTTMGISLLDCADSNIDKACDKVYDKICQKAEKLVSTGEDIEKQYGIPIINKRVSVTPIAIIAGISGGDPVKYALILSAVIRLWFRKDFLQAIWSLSILFPKLLQEQSIFALL